jgi:hypothetical protein
MIVALAVVELLVLIGLLFTSSYYRNNWLYERMERKRLEKEFPKRDAKGRFAKKNK